jgi:hypothetical protein
MSEHAPDQARELVQLGAIVDLLGVMAPLTPSDVPVGAVVLLKVIGPDGGLRLTLSSSEGMCWFERAGMLRIAEQLESSPGARE